MDKAAAIAEIRKQLAAGKIEAALQLLIVQLEPERKALRELNNRAIQAKAQLEKTQKDQADGVISFENSQLSYNQITRQIVHIVDEWEHPPLKSTPARRRITPQMAIVAVLLLVFVGMVIKRILPKKNRSGVISVADSCPPADPASFGIMILPYSSLVDPKSEDSPHRTIARRLDRFKKQYSGPYQTSILIKDGPAPDTDTEAIEAARACASELAIWGEYEHLVPRSAGTIITTTYKYLFPAETFAFTRLTIDENAAIGRQNDPSSIPARGIFQDTVRSYSEILKRGDLTRALENQFRLLFGVAVLQKGHPKEAIAILEETEARDSSSSLLKEMALAESLLQTGNEADAVKAYDRVLNTHPNYWFAINNRAMLYYKKGDYNESVNTLNRKLQEDPDNVNALTMRGTVRLKTQQLKEAEEDLRRAESLAEEQAPSQNTQQQKGYIKKKMDALEQAKTLERNRIDSAGRIIDKENTNIKALVEMAEANRNLGNYEEADRYATRILRLDERNLKALTIKLETSARTSNKREVEIVRRNVRQLDTASRRLILQDRPILRQILQNQR